ncbi:MAG: DUF4838 domain-containing protein [Candidatus Hydrogenedentes bacterium]|nr:DUF4838 domain-containing protein [Candidatus Hydrogenedentota bacterium]
MNYTRSALLIVALAAGFSAIAGADTVLVSKGQPQATIVTAASPSVIVKRAAEELQTYVARITGVKLEVRSELDAVSGARILVGNSQAVRDLAIEVPSGYTSQMNEEGFVIRAVGRDLVLAGNEHEPYRGTLFAVYAFLESLGCRWYFPGAYGEVIPARDTISVADVNRTERPNFRFRNIWYSGWMPSTAEDAANFSVWADRNKMTSLANLSLPGDGSITRLAPAEKFFESHPEIYAVDEKGQRMKDMLCLSEPEAVRIAVKTITDEFRAHPDMATFGFAPPDGHPMCHCEKCKASIPGFSGKGFGDPSLSDQWFKFANAVATEVYKEFPDRWLLTNGYANRVRPPEGVGKLAPNLGIQSAMLATCTLHSIGESKCWQREIYKGILDRWTRELNCVFIYDYDPGKSLDELPFPMLHNFARDFPYFKERNVWGFWTEGQNCWMVTHLNYYARAKLMWNAHADVKTLARDYCERFYGAAANAVEDYIWALEDAVDATPVHETFGRLMPWQTILTPEVMRRLDDDMVRAQRQAATDPERLHVRVLGLTHDHIRAFLGMEAAAARGDFAGAAAGADRMLAIREETAKVSPSLLPKTPDWCLKNEVCAEWYKRTYQGLADQMNGVHGELVALLPVRWEFKTDPEDVGVVYQWYLPNSGAPWDSIDGTLYWDLQGYQDSRGWPYAGKAWYRAQVHVPRVTQGKPVRLTVGGVYNTGVWIWVNGALADHRPRQDTKTPFDIDVTNYVRPGEMNTVAILVNTITADRSPRGGLHRRVFLWTPKG